MQLIVKFLLIGALVIQASPATAAEHRYLKAFPHARDGMVRYVILLPHKERGEENDFLVELIVGRDMFTDGVNRTGLGGSIEAKPLIGWGFTYYEVAKFGPAVSTLIGVPPGTPKEKKFVPVPSTLIPYNSSIPVVIYIPEGAEVRYRIWKASETTEKAKKG